MDLVLPSFGDFLGQVPILLIWIVGIGIAIVNLPRQPRVSTLMLISLAILLISTLAGIYLQVTLPLFLHTRFAMNFDQIGNAMVLVQLVQAFLAVIAWGLLIWAVYGWRSNIKGAKAAEIDE